MASEKIAAMIEEIKALTVLELSELVHAVEDEFGVSAAAAVAVAAPAAGDGAAAAEEKTEFDIELTEVGAEKIKVIRHSKSRLLRKTLRLSRLNLKKLALKLHLSNFNLSITNPCSFFLKEQGFLHLFCLI